MKKITVRSIRRTASGFEIEWEQKANSWRVAWRVADGTEPDRSQWTKLFADSSHPILQIG